MTWLGVGARVVRYRPFGSTQLRVSEVGFGCARIGGLFQGTSRRDTLRLLRAAFDAGITFYDTADMYAQGESERLLGLAFRQDRQQVVIASKVGYQFAAQRRLLARVKPLLKPVVERLGIQRQRLPRAALSTVVAQDFSPDYITRMVEDSLRRLQTDYLDIYQLHSPPFEVIERGDFVPALERLQQQGKIRCWGIACDTPEDALAGLRYADAGLSAVQVSLSLLHQEALGATIPQAAQCGVGVIARQAFASGLLTRRPESIPHEQLAPDAAAAERRRAEIAGYERLAQERGQSLSAFALRFVLEQSGVSVALVGMYRLDHLDQVLSYLAAAA